MQNDFFDGYSSSGMQVAIHKAIAAKEKGASLRATLEPVWMHVRGVMLARRGYPQVLELIHIKSS